MKAPCYQHDSYDRRCSSCVEMNQPTAPATSPASAMRAPNPSLAKKARTEKMDRFEREYDAGPTSPGGEPARPKAKSQLAGFRGWNNPDRFIQEIEIMLEENADLRRQRDAWQEDARLRATNTDYWKERAETAERQLQEARERIRELEKK